MAQDQENANAIEHLFTQIMADSRELQAKWFKDMDGRDKMREKELILYKHLKHGDILSDMSWLLEHCEDDY